MIYERVEGLAHMHQSKSRFTLRTPSCQADLHCGASEGVPLSDLYDDFQILDTSLATLWTMLPPLHDRSGIQPYEAYSLMNPRLFGAHATYHGSVMLLNRLWADEDDKARERAFEAARSLANLCYHSRGVKGVRAIRAYALPIVRLVPPCIVASLLLTLFQCNRCTSCRQRISCHDISTHPKQKRVPKSSRYAPSLSRDWRNMSSSCIGCILNGVSRSLSHP